MKGVRIERSIEYSVMELWVGCIIGESYLWDFEKRKSLKLIRYSRKNGLENIFKKITVLDVIFKGEVVY